MQWVLTIDTDNLSRSTIIRRIDVNRDSHSPIQLNGGCDQCAMKADDDGLAVARLTLGTTLTVITTFRGTRVLRRESRNKDSHFGNRQELR